MGGHKATQAYYQPKIEKLEARAKAAEDRAKEFETAYNALAGATQRQNDAINKLQYDLYYVKNHTLFLDTVVLFETVRVVLTGDGAH